MDDETPPPSPPPLTPSARQTGNDDRDVGTSTTSPQREQERCDPDVVFAVENAVGEQGAVTPPEPETTELMPGPTPGDHDVEEEERADDVGDESGGSEEDDAVVGYDGHDSSGDYDSEDSEFSGEEEHEEDGPADDCSEEQEGEDGDSVGVSDIGDEESRDDELHETVEPRFQSSNCDPNDDDGGVPADCLREEPALRRRLSRLGALWALGAQVIVATGFVALAHLAWTDDTDAETLGLVNRTMMGTLTTLVVAELFFLRDNNGAGDGDNVDEDEDEDEDEDDQDDVDDVDDEDNEDDEDDEDNGDNEDKVEEDADDGDGEEEEDRNGNE